MPATNHPRPSGRSTLTVEKMAAGGDGIARAEDGRVTFVEGGLPGERVVVEVHTAKKDFARARLVEVLDPSPLRVAPPCSAHAAGCGGCPWQHVDAAGQLHLKVAVVEDALRRTGRLPDGIVEAAGSVPAWAYRTTVRFAVDGRGRLGLRAGGSHRVVPADDCLVAHPTLAALAPGLTVHGADELVLRLGAATGEMSALPIGGGRSVRIDGLPGDVAVGPDAVVHEHIGGAQLAVRAASFFQSGPAAAELLVAVVRDACGSLLDADGPVLDAYGGVGLFAAALPMRSAVLVESSAAACADAAVNVPGAVIACRPFEEWEPTPVRLAVVDPARSGLGRAGAEVLAAAGPERIVLVSCDPVAMARDTALLREHGYSHLRSQVLDLFPNTPHVEVVTVFEPR